MNLIQLKNGAKQFGVKVLFDDAAFAINAGEHVGVIGPNGAGKTTLFKVLVGEQSLDAGELTRAHSLNIGYLEQEAEWALDTEVETYLAKHCAKPIWELKQLGRDLGLEESHFKTALKSLSGGYRMRVKLLYLIGQEPNLMLLDEPTNFLDLESVLALERFLQNYRGAFLLISHDREFLRRTTEYTLEVEGGEITKYPGNIDDYFEQKAQLREVLESQAAGQAAKRKQVLDFVSRFGAKATKAKQAQSRLKQLDKMDRVEIKDLGPRARITIPAPTHTGRQSIALDNCELGYPERKVLEGVSLRLERGAHLGVVGVNGAGKSTLLKSLAGTLEPLSGSRELGYQVSLSLFSQHSAEQLIADETVLESLQKSAHREVSAQDVLNMAGSLLFSGDGVSKKVRLLSGGEKSRVALGQILLKRSPLLLLDEPTNHLDFDTVEALTAALRAYAGTVIVVSHDRGFIGRIATQILEIRDGRAEIYPGTYDEYVWSVERGALSQREAPRTEEGTKSSSSLKIPKSPAVVASPASRERRQKLQAQIRQTKRDVEREEKKLAAAQGELDKITAELLEVTGPDAQELSREYGTRSAAVISLEDGLLAQMATLERIETEFASLGEN